MAPNIPPLQPPYPPETAALLARWMPPDSAIEPLALFRTLAVHDGLLERMRPLGALLLGRGRLPADVREVVIHRTSALCGAEYEWGVHAVAFARPLGFTEAQLASTVHGDAGDPCWSAAQAAAFALADELHGSGRVGPALFAELAGHFSAEQILELSVLAGWYHVIAFVINTAGVEPEPWGERFPPAP